MKNYQYLEINPAKGIGFAIGYIAILVIILSFIFGGFLGLADAVNNFGSSKALGFLAGLVCLAPIFFLMKFIYPKININATENQLMITRKNQADLMLNYNEIYALALNAQRLNTLTIYGKSNEILFHIQPFSNHQIMPELVKTIIQGSTFRKTVTKRKLFNTTYDMIVYQRS
ncbi:hypothetical protein [Pedobacter sp. Leaf250]|uniref:hypothetical protein n=1 Tax=Pedobacter sp. Leaf250 TaxID=2876559 RepID=UPI001E2D1BC8|nr:hypothetical protein [Pedobacter sp. Leaf250]